MYQISIEENIRRMLTTKKYTMPLYANFGLSDKFIDRALSNELLLELKDEILEQIKLYEPRVRVEDITIECEYSTLTLHIRTEDESVAIDLA